jgi:YggT family protein
VIEILRTFISLLGTVLWVAILIRALMSWVMPQDSSGLSRVLIEITEPVLAPIRRVLPSLGGIDFSPFLAIILIQVVQTILLGLLTPSSG